jgi:predicted alpha/beta-hydrolase family hydrolase
MVDSRNLILNTLALSKKVTIPITDRISTSGILFTPAFHRLDKAVIIAHGAGNDMNEPCIAAFAENLSQAGYVTLRFNFLYKEQGRKTPDRESFLVSTWLGAFNFLVKTSGIVTKEVVGVGKSMCGRIASQMSAQGILPVKRLIFLAYPLHSASNQNTLRDKHLYHVAVPMLFFAGTRDSLCNLDKLKTVLGRLHTDWELSVIEGGDHSFHVPKSMGINQTDIYKRISDQALDWLEE